MTAAALTTLLLTGLVVGLLAQFLAVYYRLEPQPVPLTYIGTGVIGAAGALSFVPLIMLLDYGRGASGSEILPTLTLGNLFIPRLLAAANSLLIAKALELAISGFGLACWSRYRLPGFIHRSCRAMGHAGVTSACVAKAGSTGGKRPVLHCQASAAQAGQAPGMTRIDE